MKAHLCVELPKLYVQLQATSAIIFHSLHLDVVVDSRTQPFTCLLSPFFKNSYCSDFEFCLEEIFHKNILNREKKSVTAYTDKSSSYTLTSFLLDYQIVILGKILRVVNFGWCDKSAVVEKKLCEQSSRV